MVCINSASPVLTAMLDRGLFAVNLLHARGGPAARLFSSPGADRFGQVGWAPSRRTGLPHLVADAGPIAECRVSSTRVVGDHTAVFGEVEDVCPGTGTPLLYGRRRFAVWPEAPNDSLTGHHAPLRESPQEFSASL